MDSLTNTILHNIKRKQINQHSATLNLAKYRGIK